jgi:hypothetical protein
MFLVPTFCEIVKNGRYILKMVKKNPINISVTNNGPFSNRMIISEPHYLNFSPYIFWNRQEWSLYFKKKSRKIPSIFLLSRIVHSVNFTNRTPTWQSGTLFIVE